MGREGGNNLDDIRRTRNGKKEVVSDANQKMKKKQNGPCNEVHRGVGTTRGV